MKNYDENDNECGLNSTFLIIYFTLMHPVQSWGIHRAPNDKLILLDFSLSVKAAPHECVIRTSQP